ncbi:MAG: ribokinase [Erysipelotrichaceae bacterium]|nr:ribokinase [Erysipelotrichaceae bacterium]
MKVLSFGSLNYDHVYEVEHFTEPKETQSSLGYLRNFGGKGLNQSIALAKAGLDVYHAGRVGSDGQDFIDYLNKYGVKTDYLLKDDSMATGHAIIEICNGQNRILLHGGANQSIDEAQIDDVLEHFEEGDVLLIQNEISNLSYLIESAHEKGMMIIFNTAPMNDKVFTYPLNLIDIFVVNEIEAAGLAEIDSKDEKEVIPVLSKKYPDKAIVLTAGERGSYYIKGDDVIHQDAYMVEAVDTTAAGDTFTGFFLASYLKYQDVKKALDLASRASSIAVTRRGAAQSIPSIEELA